MGIGSSGVANYANTRLALAIRTIALGNMGDFEVVSDDGVGLGLNFQTMTALDPRITFSRASNATVVGSDGLIQYAPHNLLTYSENFDNAVWVKTNATVTANAVVAPDGTITGDTVLAVTTGGDTGVRYTTTQTSSTVYTASIYAKYTNTRYLVIRNLAIGAALGDQWTFFDLLNGTIGTKPAGVTAVITPVSGGWYRCSISATTLATIPNNLLDYRCSTSDNAYSVLNTSNINLWGAQLNIGSLQPYYTTSVKNLLGYSQNFENAAWTKSNSSIDVTPVMGPLGFVGAEKLVEDTAVNVSHGFSVDTSSLSSTTQYTFSLYAKAGERTWVRLGLIDNLGIDGGRAWFDLATGVVGTVETNGAGSNINATITPIGAGWFRCRLTIQMNNGKSTLQSQVRLATANNVLSYTGDGTSGIYIFGAQLSDSASLDPYSYNFGAAPTSTAYYGPRFDYDPVTLAPKGLLIEEQRTNLLTWSDDFSNVVWNKLASTTVTANTVTSPDGTSNADTIELAGAAQGIYQTTTVTANTVYTASVYVKLGTMLVSEYKIAIYNATAGAMIAVEITPTAVVSSSTWTRIDYTFTTPVGCLSVRFYPVRITATVNATVYLYGAQLEAGTFPTSYIPTTSASVTRAADNASMVGTNFSSWYNQSEGTIYSQWMLGGDSTSNNVYNINDGTGNNLIRARYNSAGSASDNAVIVGGGVQATLSASNQVALYSSYKNAMAYKQDDFARSSSGLLITDTLGNIPTVTQINIGCGASGTEQLNGHIQSIKYYPRRLANGDLQAITS